MDSKSSELCVGGPLSQEFEGAAFGDRRLSERLKTIVDSAAATPDVGFPVQAGSDAALEGTYRFFNNDRVTPAAILEPHVTMTCLRASMAGTCLAIHDTSAIEFDGEAERTGLGPIRGKGQGFFAHVTLALSADGRRHPLGVLGLKTFVRKKEAKGRRTASERRQDPECESLRWQELAIEVGQKLARRARVIHVMDREADAYDLFSKLLEHGQSFIIRLSHDRRIVESEESQQITSLFEALEATSAVVQREVPLSRRPAKKTAPKEQGIHPPREGRIAKLSFSAATFQIRRPRSLSRDLPDCLTLNLVHVVEVDPAQGEAPVEWRLVTTERVGTPEEILAVVDNYRARWTIEEFYKALKTGCGFEKRQLESLPALLNALAVFLPVAWRLLLLRTLARKDPDLPASEALSSGQIGVLKAIKTMTDPSKTAARLVEALRRVKLSEHPTVGQALLAVAALGGHIRNNGSPGWMVLGRGFETLLMLELGFMAGLAAAKL